MSVLRVLSVVSVLSVVGVVGVVSVVGVVGVLNVVGSVSVVSFKGFVSADRNAKLAFLFYRAQDCRVSTTNLRYHVPAFRKGQERGSVTPGTRTHL